MDEFVIVIYNPLEDTISVSCTTTIRQNLQKIYHQKIANGILKTLKK